MTVTDVVCSHNFFLPARAEALDLRDFDVPSSYTSTQSIKIAQGKVERGCITNIATNVDVHCNEML